MYRDLEDIIYSLRETYNGMQAKVNVWQKTVEEWNKDDEIKKARDDAEYWRKHSLCHLSNKELERLKNFQERHYKKCAEPLHSKIVGNTYTYDLTGTGIGTIIKVTCPLCGESEDITDTSSW